MKRAGGLVLALTLAATGLGAVAAPASAAPSPDGAIACWGNDVLLPCAIPDGPGQALDGRSVVDLDTGFGHGLAVTDDGQVVAWGSNGNGESDVPASLAGVEVARVFAGHTQSVALTATGDVVEWGSLVEESSFGVPLADRLPADHADIIDVSVGPNHALALLADGTVVAWGSPGGSAAYGQPPHAAVDRPLYGKRAIDVSASVNLSMAVTTDGEVVVWGLENATTAAVLDVPDGPGEALAGKTVVAAEFGRFHALALTSEGTVVAWGSSEGDDDFGANDVPDGPGEPLEGRTVVSVDAGSHHSIAVTSAGDVVAWGAGEAAGPGGVPHWGQAAPPTGPGQALDGARVIEAPAGHLHSMALYAETRGAPVATSVGVTGVPASAPVGASVTATITVAPASGGLSPSGQVEVLDGGVKIGQVPVVNGSASHVVATNQPGSRLLTFRYAGASGLQPSVSEPVALSVTDDKLPSTTSLSAPATIEQGTAREATVAVTPGATGEVTLHGLPAGPLTATLDEGSATVSIPNTTPAGTYTLLASYAGDATHEASDSSPHELVVSAAAVTTTRIEVDGAPASGAYGTPATGTQVRVSDTAGVVAIDGGVIELYAGDTLVGTTAYQGSGTPVTIPVLPGGVHALTARFVSGEDFVLDAQTVPFEYRVSPAQPEPSIAVTGPLVFGSSRTLTVTMPRVTPAAAWPSGSISLTGVPSTASSTDLVDGVATFTIPASTPAGTYAVTAHYPGDRSYRSAAVTLPLTIATAEITMTEAPEVSGIARVGEDLTVTAGSWSPAPQVDGTHYRWLRGGDAIPGATDASYALTPEDAGQQITATVTVERPEHADGTWTSEPITIAPGVLVATTAPELTGDPVPGADLSVSDGVWRPDPAKHTYLWFRDGQPIAGEASADYRVRPDDVDHEISARVRVSAPGYAAAVANTPALRIVPGDPGPDPDPGPGAQQPDPAPLTTLVHLPRKGLKIAGAAQVGAKLKVKRAGKRKFQPQAASVTYQWYRGRHAIAGATSRKYQAVRKDRGKRISVRVTATRPGSLPLVVGSGKTRRVSG